MSGATWLASYPRSGNTWARFLMMAALGNPEHADFDQLKRFANPQLDRAMIDWLMESDSSYLNTRETLELRAAYHKARFEGVSPSQIVKVHDKWQKLSSSDCLHPQSATLAAIYLIRDPRDVATSWAAFNGRSIDWAVDFLSDPQARVGQHRHFITTTVPEHLGSWSDHAASWIDNPLYPVTVIRYEDLIADTAASLERMLATAGYHVSADVIDRAVAASHFERLVAMEREDGFESRPDTTDRFFRSGLSQAWRSILTPEQADKIVQAHSPMMLRFGYLDTSDFVAASPG